MKIKYEVRQKYDINNIKCDILIPQSYMKIAVILKILPINKREFSYVVIKFILQRKLPSCTNAEYGVDNYKPNGSFKKNFM